MVTDGIVDQGIGDLLDGNFGLVRDIPDSFEETAEMIFSELLSMRLKGYLLFWAFWKGFERFLEW